MKRPRYRALPALFALFALLFAQFAVAAYACAGAGAMVRAAVVQDEPPCERHEAPAEPTAICHAHCQQGGQSVDARGALVPALALVALPASVPIPAPVAQPAALAAGTQSSLLARPTGPPLAVRHCRFHI